jgi:hypothetical protein
MLGHMRVLTCRLFLSKLLLPGQRVSCESRLVAQTMDDGSILIAVDLDKQKQFTVEGRTITIESADASRLVYMIQ